MFIRGACPAVCKIVVPVAWKTASKDRVKFDPRSRIRNRKSTGKTPVQRRRGVNRVSAVNQARSAGSYRTRPAFRRSTAFSCRSTSSSAFFAWSPRNIRTATPKVQRMSR